MKNLGILSEKDMYLRAAERAFYRNPFSDLLIISFSALNSDDDRWKGLQLPVLLVPDNGDVPGATRREIARRKRVNLFVWGHPDAITDAILDELATMTRGKVYRILAHGIKKEETDAEEYLSTTEVSENLPAPEEEKASDSAAEAQETAALDTVTSPENNDQGETQTGGVISMAQDNVAEEPPLTEETAENVKWPADIPEIPEDQPEQEDNQEQEAPTTTEDETIPPEYTTEASPEINGTANTQAPVEEGAATGNDDILAAAKEDFPVPEELINALMASLPQEVITQLEVTLEEAAQEEATDKEVTQEVAGQEESPEEDFPEETQVEDEDLMEEQPLVTDAPREETPPDDPTDEITAEDENAWETAKEEDTAVKNIIVWRFPK